MKICTVGLLMVTALMCGSTPARADVITVTGGSWDEVGNIDGGGMTLVSDRFNVSGAWDCTNPWCGSLSWTVGSSVNLTTTTHANGHGATGTVDGVDYFFNLATGGLSFDSTQMTFTLPSFTVPNATAPPIYRSRFRLR